MERQTKMTKMRQGEFRVPLPPARARVPATARPSTATGAGGGQALDLRGLVQVLQQVLTRLDDLEVTMRECKDRARRDADPRKRYLRHNLTPTQQYLSSGSRSSPEPLNLSTHRSSYSPEGYPPRRRSSEESASPSPPYLPQEMMRHSSGEPSPPQGQTTSPPGRYSGSQTPTPPPQQRQESLVGGPALSPHMPVPAGLAYPGAWMTLPGHRLPPPTQPLWDQPQLYKKPLVYPPQPSGGSPHLSGPADPQPPHTASQEEEWVSTFTHSPEGPPHRHSSSEESPSPSPPYLPQEMMRHSSGEPSPPQGQTTSSPGRYSGSQTPTPPPQQRQESSVGGPALSPHMTGPAGLAYPGAWMTLPGHRLLPPQTQPLWDQPPPYKKPLVYPPHPSGGSPPLSSPECPQPPHTASQGEEWVPAPTHSPEGLPQHWSPMVYPPSASAAQQK